jgi:hypothetical protein
MKDNILEEVGKYRTPSTLPPISMKAYALYEEAGFIITDEAVAELRKDLEAAAEDLKLLTDTNVGLGVFALYLRDHKKDTASADKIAALMRETAPKYVPIGERIVAALQDLAINATSLLDRFTERDESAKARAPKFGETGGSGTLQLKDLKPTGAGLPRPAGKKQKPTK